MTRAGEGPPTRIYLERTAEGLACGVAERGRWERREAEMTDAGTLVTTCMAESRSVAYEIMRRFNADSSRTEDVFMYLQREIPAELEAR